jgi:hypothetical protein
VRAAHLALAAEVRARLGAAEAAAFAAERARAACVELREQARQVRCLDTFEGHLVGWAAGRPKRERVAVTALVEEKAVLSRAEVRKVFVVELPTGAFCDWERLAKWLYSPMVERGDREFLRAVLSIAGSTQVVLGTLLPSLGERRSDIVLRALRALGAPDDC